MIVICTKSSVVMTPSVRVGSFNCNLSIGDSEGVLIVSLCTTSVSSYVDNTPLLAVSIYESRDLGAAMASSPSIGGGAKATANAVPARSDDRAYCVPSLNPVPENGPVAPELSEFGAFPGAEETFKRICETCNGSSTDPNTGENCTFCPGDGWEPDSD